jgi:predicted dienelactone hydrolase
MRHLILFAILFCAASHGEENFGVGEREYSFSDTVRDRKFQAHVWYPVAAQIQPKPVIQKGNPFLPVVSAKNAPLPKAPEKFPVVLLSHGSGGKADKLFWLAGPLVRQGMIVLAVDHPRNMTGDNSADGMMRVWDRPRDLSFALDRLIEHPDFKSRLDERRVAAAGHSAGGTTVLLLAGARLSSERFTNPIPHCAGTKDPYFAKLCEEMKSLNWKAFPKLVVEGDYSDARVKAVVGLDPGMAKSFQTDSLKRLKAKALVLIADKLNAPQDEIHSKDFLGVLPAEQVKVIPSSYHMSFLQACKPGFPQDDAELRELCVENDRKLQIQKDVVSQATTAFRSAWGG